jgi:hypothetical protein
MLGNVLQSRGAEDRSAAELSLLKNENSKRVRVESTLTSGRVQEKNALSSEADGSKKKVIDTWYQKKSADAAKQAAHDGLVAATITGIFSIASAVVGGFENGFDFSSIMTIATTAFSAFMSIAAAYMAYLGAKDEADMLGKQFGSISKDAKEDANYVAAMDGNPAL